MRHKLFASFLFIGTCVFTLASCGANSIKEYKSKIEKYSNEVDIKAMVPVRESLLSLSNEIILDDYVINLDTFKRTDNIEYFKANKADTSTTAYTETSRSYDLAYDLSTDIYMLKSNEKLKSEINTVSTCSRGDTSTASDESYEDQKDKTLLFNNKNMSYQVIDKTLWKSLEENFTPFKVLHSLGVIRYFEALPQKYYIDGNQYTIVASLDKAGEYNFGELQLHITKTAITCYFHFMNQIELDGKKYSKHTMEMGGALIVKKDETSCKPRNIKKYLNIADKKVGI